MINFVIVILVTKFGDLFGCLGFLNAIKVMKRYENYAKYGEYTAKMVENMRFRCFANPTLGAAISSLGLVVGSILAGSTIAKPPSKRFLCFLGQR